MQNLFRTGRRDKNEGKIKEYLDSKSIIYVVLVPGQGADLMLIISGGVVFVEVKDPEASKSRQKLTPTEEQFKQLCAETGIEYIVVFHTHDLCEYVNGLQSASRFFMSLERR
jgi:hypothetical protein